MSKFLKFVGHIIVVVLELIGIGGIPDDLGSWQKWLGKIEPYIDDPWVRIAIILLGLIILGCLWLPRRNINYAVITMSNQRVNVRQAINFMAYETRWGWQTWLKLRGDKLGITEMIALSRFRDASRQNIFTVRGRRKDRQEHEDIDPDMWNRIKIKDISVLDATNNPGETEPAQASFPTPPTFKELSVFAREVPKAWPKASRTYRLFMRAALLGIQVWWLLIRPIEIGYSRWKRWRAANT